MRETLEGKLYATDETTRALLQESLSRLKQGLKEGLENYQSVDVFIGDRPKTAITEMIQRFE